MMMEQPQLSIVIPVFNSEQTIAELCRRIDAVMRSIGRAYELILVDDGSRDGSWNEIVKAKGNPQYPISAIRLSKNFGQHNAILCGFNFCKGGCVITMDDDLQHPPEEIPKLLQAYESSGADIVYGIPLSKKHSPVRKVGSFLVSSTSEHRQQNSAAGSSFRLIRKSLTDKLLENHSHNFLFIDAVLGWYTGRIQSVSVEHHPRKAGRSGYTLGKLVLTYFNILINYSAGPLRILTYGGLLLSIISFVIGMRFIYKKIFHHVPLGYTSLIVSVLFSTSIILFCLGIIGQYLYKLYQVQNRRPPYSIATQL